MWTDPVTGRPRCTRSLGLKKRDGGNVTAVAVLLDTGNLVLASSTNASNILWKSFDHIGDTWLPGATLRRDKVTGVINEMTSWSSRTDPAPGPYTLQLDPTGAPQFVLLWNGSREHYWATGDWNGQFFTDAPDFAATTGLGSGSRFVDNDRETSFTYDLKDNSTMHRFVMDVSGKIQGWLWVEETQAWTMYYAQPRQCAVPPPCGAFGVCTDGASTSCGCATGFSPRDAARWSLGDYSGGCVRNVELQCSKNGDSAGRLKATKEDGFFLMLSVRLPDDGRVVATGASSSSGDCERACLGNCTCSAFSYNSSCILWHGDLQNLEVTYNSPDGTAGSLYLRLASSEVPNNARSRKPSTGEIAVGALCTFCFLVVKWCGF
ncbi:hypothetical protein QOZ80_5BG0421640 [Eleusine coracana subsp. coracana]|nr:hypothetical protein QOZ80_5BG0421640 [Eleusine coracana subsp. coracana]